MSALEKAVKARGIKQVCHFTRLENIDCILQDGLLPRSRLEEYEWVQPPTYNDDYRHDGCLNAVCCSIGFPNYRMFYRLRKKNKGVEWVVLVLSPEILWIKNCVFCVENAASKNVTCIPLNERRGVQAFNKMFEEYEGKPNRKELGISDSCPTNPQAEVLVFDDIEPNLVNGAVFVDEASAKECQKRHKNIQVVCNSKAFDARKDYRYWK